MNLTAPERSRYYSDPAVRMRLQEFFGGNLRTESAAVYLATGTEAASFLREMRLVEELDAYAESGAELYRSLWDRTALLAHLDMEYVNFDFPGEMYLDPERCFRLQEPVRQALGEALESFGLAPLRLLTGRGHHVVWQIARSSEAFDDLAALGRMSPSLTRLYATTRGPRGETIDERLGAAFAGLGLVMEFFVDLVKARASARCEIPVELAAIEASPGNLSPHGREVVSLDITEYADPLNARVIRAPFSVYLKTFQQRAALGGEALADVPPIFMIPMAGMPIEDAILVARDMDAVIELASRSSSKIPDLSAAMRTLIATYRDSALARAHEWFYSAQHDAEEIWPSTYDRMEFGALPSCAQFIFAHPNDLLLRPGCVRHVVRLLLAFGWHPRHIAGLIRSKYERDYGWGEQWLGCDPATRADFYARVFTGVFTANYDDIADFSCEPGRAAGWCPVEGCQENLIQFREALRRRKNHERLGCRPFNRLILPDEHF